MHASRLNVAQGLSTLDLDLFGPERANFAGRNPGEKSRRGDFLPRTHDRAGRDPRILADFGAVEQDCADANQSTIANPAAVHDRPVSDGDLAAEDRRKTIRGHMQGGLVLNIGPLTDPDPLDVTAQYRAEEDARVLADLDVTDQSRTRCHPHRIM